MSVLQKGTEGSNPSVSASFVSFYSNALRAVGCIPALECTLVKSNLKCLVRGYAEEVLEQLKDALMLAYSLCGGIAWRKGGPKRDQLRV